MKAITRNEELILLSILQLGDEAYLVAIQDHLTNVMQKKISLTSVHLPLSRLEKNGLIQGEWDVTGARPKKYYRVTPKGLSVRKNLVHFWRKQDAILNAILKERSDV